jgi:hypothetical protein
MPVLQTQPSGPTRFSVTYEIVKFATAAPGPTYQYRRGAVTVELTAASAHPADILAVLNANVSLMAGEQIEILQVKARDWNLAAALD